MKTPLVFFIALSLMLVASHSLEASLRIFINEIHYDNASDDVGEFVEIAGLAGTDLGGWTIELYNGSNGLVYDTINLSGVIGNQMGTGFGTIVFDRAGIQNGSPDGLALVDALGNLVEFLSYEGSFVGDGGAADGETSTDIGVRETSSTPIGYSLQRVGTGSRAEDFTWAQPMADTRGGINTGQYFIPEPTSAITWSLLGVIAMMGRRRREL